MVRRRGLLGVESGAEEGEGSWSWSWSSLMAEWVSSGEDIFMVFISWYSGSFFSVSSPCVLGVVGLVEVRFFVYVECRW